jgi:predicted MFS family arabinose efflux permease
VSELLRAPSQVDNRRMYLFLLVLTAAGAVGMQSWLTLINNFAVEAAGLDGFQFGVVQGVREVPGFLALLVVFLLFVFTEHRLAAFSVLVLGAGTALTGFFPHFGGIVATTLVMSFGFHYFEPLNQSLTLQYFDPTAAPVVAGRLRAVASMANLAVGGAILLLSLFMEFRGMFLVLGGVVAMAALWALRQDPTDRNLPPQNRGMVLRRRYWIYYAMTFLAGARRQIFMAFAVFLLVQKFGYSVRGVTVLFVVNNVVNMFVSPLVGKAIVRFSERAVLTLEYVCLTGVFAAYAFVQDPWLAAALYVLDHMFFGFGIAVRTYFQKLADPGDIAPSMAVGFTINHIAAVVVPVLGGLAWVADYRMVFLGGAGLSLCSLVLAQWMRPLPARRMERDVT